MLVLARGRDQTIMIGDDIEITVVDVRGDRVRLGINAPRNISVHRKEIWEEIRRKRLASGEDRPEDSGESSGGGRHPPDDGPAGMGDFARLKRPPGGLSGHTGPSEGEA
jgi:carbon storage regulator